MNEMITLVWTPNFFAYLCSFLDASYAKFSRNVSCNSQLFLHICHLRVSEILSLLNHRHRQSVFFAISPMSSRFRYNPIVGLEQCL